MAKHASTEPNWRLSRELIIGIIAMILAVLLVLWWSQVRNETASTHEAQSQQCVSGTIELPVYVGDNAGMNTVLSDYTQSNPVVKDYCVHPVVVPGIEPAAVYITDSTHGDATNFLTAHERAAATETWPTAYTQLVGVAHPENQELSARDWAELARAGVAVPTDLPVAARSLAASALTDGNVDAAVALLHQPSRTIGEFVSEGQPLIAVPATSVPQGYAFYSPTSLAVTTRIIPLNAQGAVTEEQARAGADFAKFVAERIPQEQTEDTDPKIVQAADIISERFAEVPAVSKGSLDDGTDTLALVDTSARMDALAGQHSAASVVFQALDPLFLSVGRAGGTAALWNYSSPLNPGVVKPWRDNVTLNDTSAGVTAADAVRRLGTGGVPMTRTSLLAALAHSRDHAAETGRPVRLVLITSGTESDISDADLSAALSAYDGVPVTLNVVNVGPGPADGVIDQWASAHGGSVEHADLNEHALGATLQHAFGVTRP